MPGSYAHCFDASCPLARCLPRLAADCLTDDVTQVMAVNPRRCSHDEQCPHFRPAEEVRMARGFMHALGTVPMANLVSSRCASHFCIKRMIQKYQQYDTIVSNT